MPSSQSSLRTLTNGSRHSKKIGLKLKIFDAYRPVYVQKTLWEFLPDSNFIAPPHKGSPHSRGVAVDLTLTKDGEELDMGTGFDDFHKTFLSWKSKYFGSSL